MNSPTAASLANILGPWSESGTGSLTSRLSFALRSAILSGLLPTNSKLPAERQLAHGLAVSRHTLSNALALLKDEGLLESVQGSGTFVRGPRLPMSVSGPRMVERLLAPTQGINLSVSAPPDPSNMPNISLTLSDLMNVSPAHGYEPLGLAVLRERVAARFTTHDLPTSPDQVQITHGAFHATDLALSTVLSKHGRVAVESPSFPGIFDLINRHGAEAVEILSDAQGPRPESLARACEQGIDAVFLMPGVHNPTGRSSSTRRLTRLAAVLDTAEVAVIEDDTLIDLHFSSQPGSRMVKLCKKADVFTVGSISKLAWAGLRIGWLRSSPAMSPISSRIHIGSDLGASMPSQVIALGLWDQLDEMAERAVERLTKRRDILESWLTARQPDWAWESPQGGHSVWIELPVVDSRTFIAAAATAGVLVAPGSAAMIDQPSSPHIRLCFDQPEHLLRAALRIIDETWLSTADSRP